MLYMLFELPKVELNRFFFLETFVNRSACSNAKQGPRKQYNAFKDFHDSETTAHILAAWMQFTGMNDIEGFRKLFVYHLFY